uniref:C2H2-type domain-containing protein n=1 Tax=viral metagenome TaxID=1070528 RepID=A0A6C0KCI5_9ZZZZ
MECEFCKKNFVSKSNLYTHQNTAKYCLKIQGKDKETQFKCEFCDKIVTQRSSLEDHLDVCKEKLKKIQRGKELESQNTIKKLEIEIVRLKKINEKNQQLKEKEIYYEKFIQEKNDYIAKLEAKLEKLETAVTTIAMEAKVASKSAPTTNNTTNITVTTTNNMLNLSQEHVKKVLTDHLDYNVVYAGQAGLATFVVDKMLKNQAGNLIYRCVDPSRQMFEFEDENGETVRDMKAEKLIQSLLKGEVIRIGLEEAGKGWNTDDNELNTKRAEVFSTKVNEYANLNRNNTVFRSKVSSLTA